MESSTKSEDAKQDTIDGIEFVKYQDESQLHHVMKLVQRDLSEPYSIFTYRYFLHQFPDLCILAVPVKKNGESQDDPVGCVVCKIDEEVVPLTEEEDEEETRRRSQQEEPSSTVTLATTHDNQDGTASSPSAIVELEREDNISNQQQDTQKQPTNNQGGLLRDGENLSNKASNSLHASTQKSTTEAAEQNDKNGEKTTSLEDQPSMESNQKETSTISTNALPQGATGHAKTTKPQKTIRTGYIAMLAVDVAYRKLGIGTRLVQRVLGRMKDHYGCTSVILETEISNTTAMRLYEQKFGFIREELLVRYYLNWANAYRLRLWFDTASNTEKGQPRQTS